MDIEAKLEIYVLGATEIYSVKHCCCEEAIIVTYSMRECAATNIKQAKHMRFVIFQFAACSSLSNFSTLSHKRHEFQENFIEYKSDFSIYLQLLSERFSF